MRVLVTGASGFIGLPVVQNLEKQGHTVLAISRNYQNESLKSLVNWLKADLISPETYQVAIKEFAPQVVIHIAWHGIPDFSFDTSLNNLNKSLDLLAFIIGGSLGNLFDRIYYFAVPDFIDLHLGNFHWFIFNIADIFITVGIIGLMFTELLKKEKTSTNA